MGKINFKEVDLNIEKALGVIKEVLAARPAKTKNTHSKNENLTEDKCK